MTLEELVRTKVSGCYPTSDEDGVTVCAEHAWHMAGVEPGGLCIEGRLIEAEAAIERVRELCEQTTVSVSIGCRCYTDECSGTCGAGRPLSWHLNPAAVLAVLDGDSDE